MPIKSGFLTRIEAFAYLDEVKQIKGGLSMRAINLYQPARIRNSCGEGRLFPSLEAALKAYYRYKGITEPKSKVGKPPKTLSVGTPEEFFLIIDNIKNSGRRLTPGTIDNLHFGRAFYRLCHKSEKNPDGLFNSPKEAIAAYHRARGLAEPDFGRKKRVAPAFKSKGDVINAITEIKRRRGRIFPSDLHSYKSFRESNFSRFYSGLREAYKDYLNRANSLRKTASNYAALVDYPTPLFYRKH